MATTHLDPFTAARALAVLEDLIAGYSAARIARAQLMAGARGVTGVQETLLTR
jgi:hypothetical protein